MAIEIFSLVKERCLLGNMNIRTEMHGDERESAVDLKFSFSSANNLLSKLHTELRATFYKTNDTRDLVNPDHMPHLRFPFLGAQSWDLEIPRTRLRVHDAEDATHDVVLGGGKTNKFKLTLKEGGTVEWEFRCQFSKPDEDAIAKLMRVLNQVVPISLECVDADEKPDNFELAEQITTTPMSDARQKAEDLFAKPGDVVDNLIEQAGNDDDVVDASFDPDFQEVATGKTGDVVFPNDGVQPGDAGHTYVAEETVSVEAVRDAENNAPAPAAAAGKVAKPRAAKKPAAPADAEPADDLDQAPVAAKVTPIARGKRTTGKAAAGSNLE